MNEEQAKYMNEKHAKYMNAEHAKYMNEEHAMYMNEEHAKYMNEEHAKYARLEFFSVNTIPQILFYWHLFGASKPRYQNSQVPLFLLIWPISLATATAPPCGR